MYGARLGYVVTTKKLIDLFYQVQTATISHTGMLPQVLCAEFFQRGYYPDHLKRICRLYRERRDTMMECFDRYSPKEVQHTYPDGGMFTVDARIMFERRKSFSSREYVRTRKCSRFSEREGRKLMPDPISIIARIASSS